MAKIVKHYGTKGMKWGVRKSSSSSDRRPLSRAKGKKTKQLSDKELTSAIKRMRLEKDYKALKGGSIRKGKKLADVVLTSIATKVAINYATKQFPTQVKAISTALLNVMLKFK